MWVRCLSGPRWCPHFSEYYVHLFTSLILYATQRNGMTTKSLSSSNGLTRPITLTATTRLPASTVSQPAVMPTTCYVICWPPYMAWKRSIMTKYGVDSSISHVTSRDVQGSDAAKRDANVCSLYAAYCLARIISDPHPWQELRPTQRCKVEWPRVTLTATFSTTRSIARPLCDSWASC